MTGAQIESREAVKRLTLGDVGRSLNTVAAWFLALWAGDTDAARRSLCEMQIEPELRSMLCLAVDTIARRRRRQLDYELNGFRIHRTR
jgi:hypothetical protein